MCGVLKVKPTITKCSYHQLYYLVQDPCALFTYLLSGIPKRSTLDLVHIVAYPWPIAIMLEILCWHYALWFPAPIMLKIMLA